MSHSLSFIVQAGGTLSGECTVPGDKSVSHRSIMLAALAEGSCQIDGFLEGEDSIRTLAAFRAMGVNITHSGHGQLRIEGVGLHGLQAPKEPLYLGNSGTAMRLMCGLLSAQAFDSVLEGDESLSRRPMRRVTDPLQIMGANIQTQDNGYPPVTILGGSSLSGINYQLPVASAQIKSCLLLAGLYAKGKTCIKEPGVTRDHTERMLKAFAYEVRQQDNTVCLTGGGVLNAQDIRVPSDISSAAFFIVGASIAKGSDLVLKNTGINPTRTGILELMKMMGADIELSNRREDGFEPTADIRIRSSELTGIDIPEHLVPLAIDEFPALFIAASCAKGKTVLRNAKELRVKETDRIQAMADGLTQLGVEAIPIEDGMIIHGKPERSSFCGGLVDSQGDHRIAMAFSMAALRSDDVIHISDCSNVNTSFPGFAEMALKLGLNIMENDAESA